MHYFEQLNMLHPGTKTTILVYTMRLADYHALFLGRCHYLGNESEVREVIERMIPLLHGKYPTIISSLDDYRTMENKQKYQASSSSTTSATATAATTAATTNERVQEYWETVLTPAAKQLFQRCQISAELPAFLQLAEFRSRVTYLTFRKPSTLAVSYEEHLQYHEKILLQHGHLSILAASQIALHHPNSIVDGEKKYHLVSVKESFAYYFFGKYAENPIYHNPPNREILVKFFHDFINRNSSL
jgi:hypothetical protein